MSISAMKQALEALEWNYDTDLENIENCTAWLDKLNATIPALRQAIAEAEKIVPSDYPNSHQPDDDIYDIWVEQGTCQQNRQVAKNATTWVGLTKDEVDSWQLPVVPTVFQFAQFVEAKLKEKNNG